MPEELLGFLAGGVRRRVVGVKRVNAVVLGRYNGDVRSVRGARAGGDFGAGHNQWLRIYIPVDNPECELSEACLIHVGRIQLGLFQVDSRTGIIIALGQYVNLRHDARRRQKSGKSQSDPAGAAMKVLHSSESSCTY